MILYVMPTFSSRSVTTDVTQAKVPSKCTYTCDQTTLIDLTSMKKNDLFLCNGLINVNCG
jgi:hypothetical protein